MTNQQPVYTGVANPQLVVNTIEIGQARIRVWGSWISHVLCAPIASLVYSSKLNNYLPFFAGTGIFLFGLPLALFDVGITSTIVAPVTSAILVQNKVGEKRKKLGIFSPEQADVMLYQGQSFVTQVQPPVKPTVTGNV